MKNKLLGVGIGGSVFVALCCVTPLLPWLLVLLGAGGLVSYVYTDALLYPVLAGFLMLTVYAVWRRRKRQAN